MASGHKKRLKTLRLLGNKQRLKRLEERLEKGLEKRLKRLWVRIGATMKRLRWTSVGRWWLAWVSGATTTRYHTLRPTASTRQHGPRSLAAIISERGRCTCPPSRTSIQADHVNWLHGQCHWYGLLYHDSGSQGFDDYSNVLSDSSYPNVRWLLINGGGKNVTSHHNFVDSTCNTTSAACMGKTAGSARMGNGSCQVWAIDFVSSSAQFPPQAQAIMKAAGLGKARVGVGSE